MPFPARFSRCKGAFGPIACLALLLPLAGCDKLMALVEGQGGAPTEEAASKLAAGDLPGASDAYAAAAQAAPQDADAATGAAYTALLRGDTTAADAYLAAAEATAGEKLPEIKLRRALVALQAKDLENVKVHGQASGTPAGLLLAAEVALADGEREEAAGLLQKVAGGQPEAVAKEYLALINDPDPLVAGLSEAQALWALGEEKVAVRSVEELIKSLPDTRSDRDALLLIWAGRAASVGETAIARSLNDAVIFPPEGQAWRKIATGAIISCAEGDAAACEAELDKLEGTDAPVDGLADARATAAQLIAAKDPEAAKRLAGRYTSPAAARALQEAGDRQTAAQAAPEGPLRSYLQAGG